MPDSPLKVAWISFFPIEWLPDLPESLRNLPRQHPATWQRVLFEELSTNPAVKLHIVVVRKRFPQAMSFDYRGATFHCVKVPAGLRTLSLFWLETLLIRRLLKRLAPDLVHAWGSERGAALVASRLGRPYLVTMQGLLEWYAQQVNSGWLGGIEARLERVSLRRASLVTTESSFSVRWLRDHYPHLEVLQIEHAPGWLFHQLERRPSTRPIQFLYVGMLSQIKGTDLLFQGLDALAKELDFRLTIVGTSVPGFLEQVKTITSRALWERVEIRQNLLPHEIAAELSRTTMMLFPTRADTSPNSVKEAVVAGVPVVASSVGGIIDYVMPGRNGITFPAGDLSAFIKAIRDALAHPLFSQGRVESQVLSQMRSYLSASVMSERFQQAYQSVLSKKVAVKD